MAMTAEMSSSEKSYERKRIKIASGKGQLNDVIKFSYKFSDDVKLLSEALIRSCCKGHLDVVKWMVEHTVADVNYIGVVKARYTWGEEVDVYHTPLTAACLYKHLNVIKYLVKIPHVDINLPKRKLGFTPLIQACVSGSIRESMYLLNEISDLDVNFVDGLGNTALHFAVSSGKDLGYTQLHKACIKGDLTEVMRLVYLCNHMVNVQDNGNYTPLHYACRFGHSEIVKTLMFAGADEAITDVNWRIPAQEAERQGHSELLKLLDRVTLLEVMQTNGLSKFAVKHHKLSKTKRICCVN